MPRERAAVDAEFDVPCNKSNCAVFIPELAILRKHLRRLFGGYMRAFARRCGIGRWHDGGMIAVKRLHIIFIQ